ncbi:AI-2E family transporter [Halorussus aquaticus]|uniref:AI-2E family transporter n=1 Tax=Halorussus aquaticus TaxID=2953748 RepID=A0ABD5Q2S7_9EURY|nr:AI-2E family transporter [Halorussus aquaticus]
MSARRQWVLAGVLVLLGLLSAAVLFDVLGTVFFAVTVAYVLVPLHQRFVERGMPSWWASAASTAVAFVGVLLFFASFGFLVYRRRDDLLRFLLGLPESFTVELLGAAYTIDAGVLTELARTYLGAGVIALARLAPVLALKGTLFALLVFALLVRRREARRALLAPIPHAYRDVVAALHERTRETLSAIYVLQAATAVGTFLVALPVFYVLGYEFVFTLALVAGFLQFLPIVGPSFLVVLLAVYRVTANDVVGAVLVLVLGGVVVGWLPDAVIRTRLARQTANLPGSLYFIGFTGGLLSVGPIGFIAGPLVVALLAEATELLAAEVNGHGHARTE